MALGALTLSVTQGVQGRPFASAINGLTTGLVEVLQDGAPGFYVANGVLRSNGLPYPVSTAVLREYEPGVGAGYLDTRIAITATTPDAALNLALESLGDGRTLTGYVVAAAEDEDGSLSYSVYARDDLGATVVTPVGGGGGSSGPGFTLSPGFTIVDLGDSLRAAGRDGGSGLTTADTTNLGGLEIARAKYPYFAYDLYPADTSAIETGYGATEYTWGANLGYAGSPIDYVQALLPDVLAMSPDAIYWGPTINSVADASIVTKINTLVADILAGGVKLFLRTLPPVVQGSTFDNASYPTAYPAINAAVRSLAAANPDSIRLIDLDPVMCIASTIYRKAGQTYDGTHNNEAGSVAEVSVLGPILTQHVPEGTNVIESDYEASAVKVLPNPEMGGYAGSRSGNVTYAGPGFSAPSGYTFSFSGTASSTATVGVESNTARGGFTIAGRIASTTLTVDSVNGVIVPGSTIIGGPGISANTLITAQLTGTTGGAGTYTVSVSQTAGKSASGSSISGTTLTVSSGTGIAVGMAVTGSGVTPGTVITAGSGTSWTVNNSQTVASTTLTFTPTINVGPQRVVITVTPSGTNTNEVVQMTLNPSTYSTTALQSKYGRGVALVELDDNPAWRMPTLLLTDRYNPGTETSGKTSNAYKRHGNSDAYGGPGEGVYWIQTNSVAHRADSVGVRMTLQLNFCPNGATGPMVAYIELADAHESADDPTVLYPFPA